MAPIPLLRADPLLRLDTFEELSKILKADYYHAEIVHRFKLHRKGHHFVDSVADNLRDVFKGALTMPR